MRFKLLGYIFLLLVVIPIISLLSCAGEPAPALQWSKVFDGICGSVQQTKDSGYIICGNTESYVTGGLNGWLIKTDANGNKLWEKTLYNGENRSSWSAQQTTDDGYIICGAAASATPQKSEILLTKTDANGDILWTKMFSDEQGSFGYSVQQTRDGGYVLLGTVGTDIWLIKTDAEGNKLWDKKFRGKGINIGSSVQQTSDAGYIICGTRKLYQAGDNGAWLIKTDVDGNKLWDKTYGGAENDYGSSAQQTVDGGYIVCGSKYSAGKIANPNILVVKVDSDGNTLWDKTFGDKKWVEGSSVVQTQDGGYSICGTVDYKNIWLIKVNSNGDKLWDKTFRGEEKALSSSIQQTTDGGYIICGTTGPEESKVLLLKIAPE